MNYIKLPYMDSEVSIFAVCQAHAQLESDYNKGGILWERPSNRRRRESTGCQLARMKYSPGHWWVDVTQTYEDEDPDDMDVRDIYIFNVLKWALPIDKDMARFIRSEYSSDWLQAHFPGWEKQIEEH